MIYYEVEDYVKNIYNRYLKSLKVRKRTGINIGEKYYIGDKKYKIEAVGVKLVEHNHFYNSEAYIVLDKDYCIARTLFKKDGYRVNLKFCL